MRLLTRWAIVSISICLMLIVGLHASSYQSDAAGNQAFASASSDYDINATNSNELPIHIDLPQSSIIPANPPREPLNPQGCVSGQSCLNCSCGSSCQCYESARLRKEIQRQLMDLNKPNAGPDLIGHEARVYLRTKERRVEKSLVVCRVRV